MRVKVDMALSSKQKAAIQKLQERSAKKRGKSQAQIDKAKEDYAKKQSKGKAKKAWAETGDGKRYAKHMASKARSEKIMEGKALKRAKAQYSDKQVDQAMRDNPEVRHLVQSGASVFKINAAIAEGRRREGAVAKLTAAHEDKAAMRRQMGNPTDAEIAKDGPMDMQMKRYDGAIKDAEDYAKKQGVRDDSMKMAKSEGERAGGVSKNPLQASMDADDADRGKKRDAAIANLEKAETAHAKARDAFKEDPSGSKGWAAKDASAQARAGTKSGEGCWVRCGAHEPGETDW